MAYVQAVSEPAVKALFTDRGFPATFDTQLTATVTAFAGATGRQADGRRNQKEGSVALKILTARAVQVMKELGPLVEKHLRLTNPMLVDVWKAASRLYRGSQSEEPPVPEVPVTPPASGS